MTRAETRWLDHPGDVLAHLLRQNAAGRRAALLVVTETVGGALRAPGALAAVEADGTMAGYVSNGCVDADIALQALAAMQEGRMRQLRYGAGSPWPDIRLPCGGSVELALVPDPDPALLSALASELDARRPGLLRLDTAGLVARGGDAYLLRPRPRLRLAGRGAALAALARLGVAGGFEVRAASPDADDLAALQACGVARTDTLSVPAEVPPVEDDPWTAVALLFHDHDWEPALLRQALDGRAAFIGALGSRRTHAARLESLRRAGVPEAQLARIVGPLGLVGSLRDANMIAVSALAQMVAALQAAQDAEAGQAA
jgi:xanthine dehydrogenase accessory factor